MQNGSVVRGQAARVAYSADTAGLYGEASRVVASAHGALALKPQMEQGWRTYNFEVSGLHTYVAGGVRVHNDCTVWTDLSEATLATLHSMGLSPNDFEVFTADNGDKIAIVWDDAKLTHADGTETSLTDLVGMVQEGTEAFIKAVGNTLSNFPSYLNGIAPNVIADLVTGGDLEEVAERYAIQVAAAGAHAVGRRSCLIPQKCIERYVNHA